MGEFKLYGDQYCTNIDKHLDITDLASILAVCSNKIGPVKLKQIGDVPLFKLKNKNKFHKKIISKGKPREAYYEELFYNVHKRYDEVETSIHLYKYIDKAKPNLKAILPEDYKTFINAAFNFIMKMMWIAINDHRGPKLTHPVRIEYKRKSTLNKEIKTASREIFRLFKVAENNGVSQNDFFRTRSYWEKAALKVLSAGYIKKMKRAINKEKYI